MKADQFTREEVFAAIAVFEELETTKDAAKAYPTYHAWRENNGVCEARDHIADLGRQAQAVWEACDGQFDAPFDYEFVPAFLSYCTDAGAALDQNGGVFNGPLCDFTRDAEKARLFGRYICLINDFEGQAQMAKQAMRELHRNGVTPWSPERILAGFQNANT